MTDYEKKLERQNNIQAGRDCEMLMDKYIKDFIASEKQDVLNRLLEAEPDELANVQARYQELMKFRARLISTINKGKESERKIHRDSRREQ